MATESVIIEVNSKGTVTVKKELEAITKAAKDAALGFAGLKKQTDGATPSLGRFENASNKAKNGISGMRSELAGLVTIGTAVLALNKFIAATVELENVQAQLAAGLKSTAGASGQTIESLNAHAAALQNLTTFSDEAVGAAQGIFLTFTKISGDVFPAATAAATDLATRMGGDLNGAALQLGKALNDPIRGVSMLGRAGVQFSAEQRGVIANFVETNQLAKAQAVILGELTTQFGGSAAAARNTLGGSLAGLRNAFDNLFEVTGPATLALTTAFNRLAATISNPAFQQFALTIGSFLFGALTGATNALNSFLLVFSSLFNAITSIIPLNSTFVGQIASFAILTVFAANTISLVGAFSRLLAILPLVTLAVRTLTALLMRNPFILAIAGGVALGAILIRLLGGVEGVRQKFNALQATLSNVWGLITTRVSTFFSFFTTGWQVAVTFFTTRFTNASTFIGNGVNRITSFFGNMANAVRGLWNGLISYLSSAFFGFINRVISAIQSVIGLAGKAASKVGGGSGGKTPAFKDGGVMDVKGAGGPDSKLAQFRVSPNERITVNTPQEIRKNDRQQDYLQSLLSRDRVTTNTYGGIAGGQIGESFSEYEARRKAKFDAEKAAKVAILEANRDRLDRDRTVSTGSSSGSGVNITNVISPTENVRQINTFQGSREIMNVITSNQDEIRSILRAV